MSTPEPPAVELGCWLSSEEHGARALVTHAAMAEAAGFEHAMISDHLHPWVPAQGHAPFVWGVLGAIAHATSTIHLATGVTAVGGRMHPVVVAHAAATAAVLLEGRFALGLGTGERLNEHVVGGPWPRPKVRREQLEEAIDILRQLFDGDEVSVDGSHHTVEHAQLWTLPATPPPMWVAASGRRTAEVAGRHADGLIALAPDPSLVGAFEQAGGTGPRCAQLHLCWAPTRGQAVETALRWWPQSALPPPLLTELARPAHLAAAAAQVTGEQVAEQVLCGPDPEPVVTAVLRFAAAGFTRVYLHQVGPDQAGFLRFCERELRPALA